MMHDHARSTQKSAQRFPVTETTLRIALRRVRQGKVRRLLGGEIVDAGRRVPIYVTASLHELVEHEQVTLNPDGDLFEITPAGQDLYDEPTQLGPTVHPTIPRPKRCWCCGSWSRLPISLPGSSATSSPP